MAAPATLLLRLILTITSSTLVAAVHINSDNVQEDVSSFWTTDVNRAENGQVVLDFQQHTNAHDRVDRARKNLFQKVDEKLLRKPTYKALIDLFVAYDSHGRKQQSAPDLRNSIENFLDKISATRTYKVLQEALAAGDYEPAKNGTDFRKALYELWFGDYFRGKAGQSSGFEHVFIGERKERQVIGLHSWVRAYWLESQKKLDYTGFILKRDRVPIVQFKLGQHWKPAGSMMIGTSPEFDFAVFTLCFVGKRGNKACKFFLGDCTAVQLTSYPFNWKGAVYIGTAYPSPWKTDDNCPITSSSSKKRKNGVEEDENKTKKFKFEVEDDEDDVYKIMDQTA